MQFSQPDFWTHKKQVIALAVLGFFLTVGCVGYFMGITGILQFTPILLASILAMMIIIWDAPAKAKLISLGIVWAGGFVVEQIGVHTGLLFGEYSYGSLLGYRVFGVPILIGLTWCIVTLSAWHIASLRPLHTAVRFGLAGTLVVMLDLVLEQFAVVYGLWGWQGGDVPLYNYISWFMISQLFFFVYFKLVKKLHPSLYVAGVLPLLALFFWCMLLGK